jgi:hypothetical protein
MPVQPMVSTSDAPAQGVADVTPHDADVLTVAPCRSLWVGTGGDLSVLMADGTTAILQNVPSGTVVPVAVRRVNSTNTTATDIVALY